MKHRKETGSLLNFPGATNLNTREDALELDCDILIPAALENQITEDNAGEIYYADYDTGFLYTLEKNDAGAANAKFPTKLSDTGRSTAWSGSSYDSFESASVRSSVVDACSLSISPTHGPLHFSMWNRRQGRP